MNRRKLLKGVGIAGAASVLASQSVAAFDADKSSSQSERITRPFEVDASDDTTLRGHVHTRDVAIDQPAPAVLFYSPYWGETSYGPTEDAPSAPGTADGGPGDFIRRFLDEGFVVAAVCRRGTGSSDGCYRFGAPIEADDVNRVVDGVAGLPFVDGTVGMVGFSLDGMSISLALADEESDALHAVVPVDSVIDYHSWWHFNGAKTWDGPAGGVYDGDVLGGESALHPVQRLDPRHFTNRLTCEARVAANAEHLDSATDGAKTDWWDARDWRADIHDSDVPMFVSNGLRRPHNLETETAGKGFGTLHITQFRGLYEGRPENSMRMLLGQWGHQWAATDDFLNRVVDFLDHHLRQHPGKSGLAPGKQPDGAETGIVRYQDDTGAWHTADQWPPAGDDERVYLSREDIVGTADEAVPSARSFQSDEYAPGLREEQCGEHRQLLYRSEPLDESVHLAGEFTAELTVQSTLPAGRLVVSLFRTPNDGTCPDPDAEEIARLYADLRHHERVGEPEAFPTGRPVEVSFDSLPFASAIPAGERLVVGMCGGSDVVMNDENQPAITVQSGVEGSAIELPVVEGELAF